MLDKTTFGRAMKKICRKYGITYFNSYRCCNTCFQATLEDKGIVNYMYLKFTPTGMNGETKEQFEESDEWYVSYNSEVFNYFELISKDLLEELKGYKFKIDSPKDSNECYTIVREF